MGSPDHQGSPRKRYERDSVVDTKITRRIEKLKRGTVGRLNIKGETSKQSGKRLFCIPVTSQQVSFKVVGLGMFYTTTKMKDLTNFFRVKNFFNPKTMVFSLVFYFVLFALNEWFAFSGKEVPLSQPEA